MKKQINRTAFQQSLDQAGLNASQLADKLGVSREAVSKWMRGDSFPRPDKLLRLGMILNRPYESLVKSMSVNEPRVAYRAKVNQNTQDEHLVQARNAGVRLRQLVKYLPFDKTCPPTLKAPKSNYEYIQGVITDVRSKMKVLKNGKIGILHFLEQFKRLDAVLIPVFWGGRKQHGNALHVYLPDSMTTWVWLNLDSKICDFMFWMAHELGHAYSPDLSGDEAEDFADLFAQCLLYPQDLAKNLFYTLSGKITIRERWDTVVLKAKAHLISPYTIIKALKEYADYTGKPEIDFGKFDSKLKRFNASMPTVGEHLFKGDIPEPAKYIQICSEAFGTPFFEVLTAMAKDEKLTPSFLSEVMNIPLIDAKSICAELS